MRRDGLRARMGRAPRRVIAGALVPIAAAVLLAARVPVSAAAPVARADRTTWDSVFTVEQATRGQLAYDRSCARCHHESLGGVDHAPALAGGTFLSKWTGLTVAQLHDRVRTTMPPNGPGIYGRQLITDVLAYMLSVNGFPAGRTELPVQGADLEAIRIEATRP